MSVNILDLVKGAVGKQVLEQFGGILGESRQKTQSAIDAAAPAILGGLMKKAGTSGGAKEIFDSLDDNDGGLLDNLGGALGGGNHESILSKGSGLLGMIFGSQQSSIVGTIAKLAGIGTGSAGSLLGMLAPIIMGVLGKQRKSSGLDMSGLTGLLMSQKSHLADAVPKELGSQLGFADLLGDGAKAVSNTVNAGARSVDAVAQGAKSAGGGLGKMLIPLLVLAAIVFFGIKMMMGGGGDEGDEGGSGLSIPEVSLPGVDLPNFDLDKVNTGLTESFGNVTDALGSITDEASAKLAVPKIEDATKAFEGLGLSNMPEAAKSGLSGTIQPLLEKIQAAVETAYAIPGVKSVLEPVVGPFLEKVGALAG